MRHHRGGTLWIIGRIGILVCFGILPLLSMCERVKSRQRYSEFWIIMNEAHNSNEFGEWEQAGKWLDLADFELKNGSAK